MLNKLFPNTSKEFEKFLDTFITEFTQNIEKAAKEVKKEFEETKVKLQEEAANIFCNENKNIKVKGNKENLPLNICETLDNLIIEIGLPGVEKDNIFIDITEEYGIDKLVILAERKNDTINDCIEVIKNISDTYLLEFDFEEKKYKLVEATASYNNGLLTIKIPLNKTKKIEIQ